MSITDLSTVPDLYTILKLDRSILKLSEEKIKSHIESAYATRVKECHPDKFMRKPKAQRDAAAKTFEMVTEAYDILKSPESRNSYNNILDKSSLSEVQSHESLKKASLNYMSSLPKPDPNQKFNAVFKDDDYYGKLTDTEAQYYKEKVEKSKAKSLTDLLKERMNEREEFATSLQNEVPKDTKVIKNISDIFYKPQNLYEGVVTGDKNNTYGAFNGQEYGGFHNPTSFLDVSGKIGGMNLEDYRNKSELELQEIMIKKLKERGNYTTEIENSDFSNYREFEYGGEILGDNLGMELLTNEETLNMYNNLKNKY